LHPTGPRDASFSPYHDDDRLADFLDDDAQRITANAAVVFFIHLGIGLSLSSSFIVPDLKPPPPPEAVKVEIVTFDPTPEPEPEPIIVEPKPAPPPPAPVPKPQPEPTPSPESQARPQTTPPPEPITEPEPIFTPPPPPPEILVQPEPEPLDPVVPVPLPVPEPEPIIEFFEPIPEPIPEPLLEPIPEPEPIIEFFEPEPELELLPIEPELLPTPGLIEAEPLPEIIEPEPLPPEIIIEPEPIAPEPITPEPEPLPEPIPEPTLEIIPTAPTVLASPDAPETREEERRAVPQEQSDPFIDLLKKDRSSTLNDPVATPQRGGGNQGPISQGGSVTTPPGGGTRIGRPNPGAGGWTLAPQRAGPGKAYEGINLDIRCREEGRTHNDCPEYIQKHRGRDASGRESFDGHAGTGADRGNRISSSRTIPSSRSLGLNIGDNSINAGGPSTNALDFQDTNFDREFPGTKLNLGPPPKRVRDIFDSPAAPPAENNWTLQPPPADDKDEKSNSTDWILDKSPE